MEKVGRQTRGYKVAGRTGDGVRILEPKTKPTHFTSRERRSTLANLKRDSATGRFVEQRAASKDGRKRS